MKKLSLLYISFLAALGMLVPVLTSTASAEGSTVDFKAEAQCQTTDTTECVDEAQDPAATGDCTKDSCDLIGKYVNPFIKLLGIIVGLAVTIGIAYGGIEYSSSGGDPQKASSGKKHITMAIIALVAYFFLFAGLKFLTPGGF